MKLIIQIPCYNEEQTLALALAALPRQIPGIDTVEWLIIDDGSSDKTAEVARTCGVDHIVRHPTNLGLARAFMTGLETALKAGADIIINTDADNQYNADDIPKLIEPILAHRAEFVIGARPIAKTEHFSPIKKALQHLGSWVVRKVSQTSVQDAPSGFRAISRSAAAKLIVFDPYTYTLETIIQSGRQGIALESVSIRTNEDLRPSRLVRSISNYVKRSMSTILRISVIYSPSGFFLRLAQISALISVLFAILFGWHYWHGNEDQHIPTLIVALGAFALSIFLIIIGVLGDLLAINRRLLQDIRRRQIELELRVINPNHSQDSTSPVQSPVQSPQAGSATPPTASPPPAD